MQTRYKGEEQINELVKMDSEAQQEELQCFTEYAQVFQQKESIAQASLNCLDQAIERKKEGRDLEKARWQHILDEQNVYKEATERETNRFNEATRRSKQTLPVSKTRPLSDLNREKVDFFLKALKNRLSPGASDNSRNLPSSSLESPFVTALLNDVIPTTTVSEPSEKAEISGISSDVKDYKGPADLHSDKRASQ